MFLLCHCRCHNHPEFPFNYDARHPYVNRGKGKRCRNPYGTPPRYDFLDPNCPFPIDEYDHRTMPPYAQESCSICKKRPLTEEETRVQEIHKERSEKVTEPRSVSNSAPNAHERAPSQAINLTPNTYHGRRDEADHRLPKIWVNGYIRVILMTENGPLKDVPKKFSGKFQVPLTLEDNENKLILEETDSKDKHICCSSNKEAVKRNSLPPN